MQYLLGFSGDELPNGEQLAELYGANDASELQDYLARRCRFFFRPAEWAIAASRFVFGFGTRLHGTIMMLNSGVAAVMVTHDSRTQEVAEFANIPAVPADGLEICEKTLQEVYAGIDLASYYARRQELRRTYHEFLHENDLATRTEASGQSSLRVAV